MRKLSLILSELRLSLLLFAVLSAPVVLAQPSTAVRSYIARFADIAIAEEIRTGVPASITLAQGIHESGAGQSDLVRRSNNHFGIKCKTEWTGEKVYHDDDARGECFRKYEDPEQSYRDHSDFLKNRKHYASLFRLDPTDFEGWAYGLKKAGYATNPKYPQILIRIIRDYNLHEYTLMAQGRKPRIPAEDPVAPAVAVSGPAAVTEPQFAGKAAEPVAPATPGRYPQGRFQINGLPVVFVSKGTSLRSIARQYGVSPDKLYAFNDLEPMEEADVDMLVFLQQKRRHGATDLHLAREGERLWDVAQAEGVQIDALLDYNGLGYDRTFVAGELIALSGKASRPEFTPAGTVEKARPDPASPGRFLVHIVQPKETMYALSKKYGVRVEDIQQWNNLPTTELKIGQEVRIKKS